MPICFSNFEFSIMRMGFDFRFHVLWAFVYAMGFMGFAGLMIKMFPQIRNSAWVSDLWSRKNWVYRVGPGLEYKRKSILSHQNLFDFLA